MSKLTTPFSATVKERAAIDADFRDSLIDELEWSTGRIEKLEAALRHIVRHMEIVGGSFAQRSATWLIATRALEETKQD